MHQDFIVKISSSEIFLLVFLGIKSYSYPQSLRLLVFLNTDVVITLIFLFALFSFQGTVPDPCGTGMVGLGRLELPTSRLSGVRSNRLSYKPKFGGHLLSHIVSNAVPSAA